MSDQDFFDDEDGAKASAKAPAKTPTKAATKTPATNRPPAATPPAGTFFAQSISMSIAALMAVIALLVGVIVGIVIPTGGRTPVVNTSNTAASETTAAAPQITQDQIKSGELPAGHPDLSGMTSSSTASGSTDTTSK